jgi:type I restriction enzyme S subunit
MIADLKPYTEYKDSGSRWLQNVPAHWEVRKLRTLIRRQNGRNRPELPLLSVAREKGVFVRSLTDAGENHNVIPEDLSNYKVALIGNLVINKMKAWQGSMGIAPCDGIVSPAYFVFDFDIADRAFGQALLRSKPYVSHFGQASDGVRVGQWDLTIAGMRQIPVLVPPPAEQAAIVRFLDWANRRLERAIRAKRRVIALLNEQKQVIIHRAVTRGLDPSVPLKPSGIPWLGDIPQNFKRTKLGRVCVSIRDGTHNPPPALPGIHRLLSVRNVVNGHFVVRDDDRTMTSSAFAELQRSYTVRRGDVVIAIVGATTGKSAVVGEMRDVTVQRSLAILRPNSMLIDSGFLNLLISSRVVQSQIKQIMDKYAAQPGIYLNELSGLQMVYPSMTEQASIVAHVRDATGPLNTAISRLEREIDLLREYRTRLIADVVTGKLDVREAAAQLPEEPTPDTPEEDADLIIDSEAADEELAV